MRISFFVAATIAASSVNAFKIDSYGQTNAQQSSALEDKFASYAAKVLGSATKNTLMDKEVQQCIMDGASHIYHTMTGKEDYQDEDFDEFGFHDMIGAVSSGVSSLAHSASDAAHHAYDSASHMAHNVEEKVEHAAHDAAKMAHKVE